MQLHVEDNIDKNCNQFIKLFDKTIDIKMCKDIDTLYFEVENTLNPVIEYQDPSSGQFVEAQETYEIELNNENACFTEIILLINSSNESLVGKVPVE